MFRICKAEFKKLFYKPSIFVVTGLLILVLALSTFLYDVVLSNRDNLNVNYEVTESVVTGSSTNNTVLSIYQKFMTDSSSERINVNYFCNLLTNYKNYQEKYEEDDDFIATLKSKIEIINSAYSNLISKYSDYILNGLPKEQVNSAREAFKQSFDTVLTFYKQNVVDKISTQSKDEDANPTTLLNTVPQDIKVLAPVELNKEINAFFITCKGVFDNTTTNDINLFVIQQFDLDQYNYSKKLNDYFDRLVPFKPDIEYVKSLDVYFDSVSKNIGLYYDEGSKSFKVVEKGSEAYLKEEYKSSLLYQIDEFKNQYGTGDANTSTENKKTLLSMITKCKLSVLELQHVVVDYGIKVNGLKNYSDIKLTDFAGFEKSNLYQMKEEFTRNEFLLKTGGYLNDYANPFSLSQPSNSTVDCFDFSYFAMRLCMFVIIVYTVSIAATTIVGEQASGTMKLLAIRPFKRNKLLGGKLLATILIGCLLVAVSSIATIIMGAVTYGANMTNVLMVFNATSAVVVNPIILYLLMLLTVIFEMIFFIAIALLISLLFKSQVVSVAVSMLIYFGTLVLNALSASAPFLRFLPFTNVNLYKYFGSSFLSTKGGFLEAVLNPSVVLGADFVFSFVYVAIFTVAVVVASFEVFKRRDLR